MATNHFHILWNGIPKSLLNPLFWLSHKEESQKQLEKRALVAGNKGPTLHTQLFHTF